MKRLSVLSLEDSTAICVHGIIMGSDYIQVYPLCMFTHVHVHIYVRVSVLRPSTCRILLRVVRVVHVYLSLRQSDFALVMFDVSLLQSGERHIHFQHTESAVGNMYSKNVDRYNFFF